MLQCFVTFSSNFHASGLFTVFNARCGASGERIHKESLHLKRIYPITLPLVQYLSHSLDTSPTQYIHFITQVSAGHQNVFCSSSYTFIGLNGPLQPSRCCYPRAGPTCNGNRGCYKYCPWNCRGGCSCPSNSRCSCCRHRCAARIYHNHRDQFTQLPPMYVRDGPSASRLAVLRERQVMESLVITDDISLMVLDQPLVCHIAVLHNHTNLPIATSHARNAGASSPLYGAPWVGTSTYSHLLTTSLLI